MNGFVTDFQSDKWRIAHCHHSSLHLNVSEDNLSQWRQSVESPGYNFIAHVMFCDPLSHTLSLYKHLQRFNYTREGWLEHLANMTEMGPWQTQLDYFLYNSLARNPVSTIQTNCSVNCVH